MGGGGVYGEGGNGNLVDIARVSLRHIGKDSLSTTILGSGRLKAPGRMKAKLSEGKTD